MIQYGMSRKGSRKCFLFLSSFSTRDSESIKIQYFFFYLSLYDDYNLMILTTTQRSYKCQAEAQILSKQNFASHIHEHCLICLIYIAILIYTYLQTMVKQLLMDYKIETIIWARRGVFQVIVLNKLILNIILTCIKNLLLLFDKLTWQLSYHI